MNGSIRAVEERFVSFKAQMGSDENYIRKRPVEEKGNKSNGFDRDHAEQTQHIA